MTTFAPITSTTTAHAVVRAQPQLATKLPAPVMKKIDAASQSFESMFTSQMMQFMWTGNEADATFGGGHGEEMWRSQLVNEFGKISSGGKGLGIADSVKTAMIDMQLRAQHQLQAAQQTALAAPATPNIDPKETVQ